MTIINLSFTSKKDGKDFYLSFESLEKYFKRGKPFFGIPSSVTFFDNSISIRLLQPIYYGGENV